MFGFGKRNERKAQQRLIDAMFKMAHNYIQSDENWKEYTAKSSSVKANWKITQQEMEMSDNLVNVYCNDLEKGIFAGTFDAWLRDNPADDGSSWIDIAVTDGIKKLKEMGI